jgi:plasmid stability protein
MAGWCRMSNMATEFRIHNLPESVHKALKIKAVNEGVPLNDLIISILRAAVEKQRKK